jgi:hypothetical protein
MPPEALATVQLDTSRSSHHDLTEDPSLLVDLDMNVELTLLDSIDGEEGRTSTEASKLMSRLDDARHH